MTYKNRYLILLCLFASTSVWGDYQGISADLSNGLTVLEVAEQAHENQTGYYDISGLPQLDMEHSGYAPELRDDNDLSAYEAVEQIFLSSDQISGRDPDSDDIVSVVLAVIDAWTECEHTYQAVKRGVELVPDRAAEIASAVAVKKDCNCSASGIWPQQRLEERVQVDARHAFLDVPASCSCAQTAMHAAVSALPENQEYIDAETDQEREQIARAMLEKTEDILDRTNASQSKMDWSCGCSDLNLAASMRAIQDDDLRGETWDGIAEKYADEAGDLGLIVDSFGIVGRHPLNAWGHDIYISRENSLRRNPDVLRGDRLVMDPFDPSYEWTGENSSSIVNLGAHQVSVVDGFTDLIISEYVEGWNAVARAQDPAQRAPDERNRIVELYNGSKQPIDLGQGQYVLEVYSGGDDGGAPRAVPVVAPPKERTVVRNQVTLDAEVTFRLDSHELTEAAKKPLDELLDAINNANVVSEVLIVGHTCSLAPDDYNQTLSENRAKSVREYLSSNGLNVQNVRVEGRGESEPAFSNETEESRRRNRRVEITYVTEDEVESETFVDNGAVVGWDRQNLSLTDNGELVEGRLEPDEVIALSGEIEPGQTFIIAYDKSDDEVLDQAAMVTGQLGFKPTDTLVLRRFGGERALSCRASGYVLAQYPLDDVLRLRPRPTLTPIIGPVSTDPGDTGERGGEKASPD